MRGLSIRMVNCCFAVTVLFLIFKFNVYLKSSKHKIISLGTKGPSYAFGAKKENPNNQIGKSNLAINFLCLRAHIPCMFISSAQQL